MTDKRADTHDHVPSFPTRSFLSARVRLPQHVVHRSFVAETVVLNLRTGKYHGLNPTAGKMLEALDAAPTVGAAVPVLARRIWPRGGADSSATCSPSPADCSNGD